MKKLLISLSVFGLTACDCSGLGFSYKAERPYLVTVTSRNEDCYYLLDVVNKNCFFVCPNGRMAGLEQQACDSLLVGVTKEEE